jgi:hypothetical protein
MTIGIFYNVPKAPLGRSKLIFAEIEGLDSIHKVLSRKQINVFNQSNKRNIYIHIIKGI